MDTPSGEATLSFSCLVILAVGVSCYRNLLLEFAPRSKFFLLREDSIFEWLNQVKQIGRHKFCTGLQKFVSLCENGLKTSSSFSSLELKLIGWEGYLVHRLCTLSDETAGPVFTKFHL